MHEDTVKSPFIFVSALLSLIYVTACFAFLALTLLYLLAHLGLVKLHPKKLFKPVIMLMLAIPLLLLLTSFSAKTFANDMYASITGSAWVSLILGAVCFAAQAIFARMVGEIRGKGSVISTRRYAQLLPLL